MFPVGPPKPDRPEERGQTVRDKLVLQEWGFCGWVGNPPKENEVLKSKDAQPWIEIVDAPGNDGNAPIPEQVKRPYLWRKIKMIIKSKGSLV